MNQGSEPEYDDSDLYVSEEDRQAGEDLAVLCWEADRGDRHRQRDEIPDLRQSRSAHSQGSWAPGEEPF